MIGGRNQQQNRSGHGYGVGEIRATGYLTVSTRVTQLLVGGFLGLFVAHASARLSDAGIAFGAPVEDTLTVAW
ncbi:hypothetical protein X989_5016 [Burkholderia pseudomallei MSHR4378]|nr:hypothetical protein X989_5016 [Burkholderia pseudomallei MSHR4378]